MTARRTALSAVLALCLSATAAFGAATQAVTFQGRIYDVSFLTPGGNVPAWDTNDLIFYQDSGGNRFLMLPTDATLRGDFDITNQQFYVLSTSPGATSAQINAFDLIDATVMDLNAQFVKSISQFPAAANNVYNTPVSVSESSQDVCTIDSSSLGLRTDGPNPGSTTDEHIFTITRQTVSTVLNSVNTGLFNTTDPFVAYDPNNATFLTVERALGAGTSTTFQRITSFNSADGSVNSIINLTTLDPSLGFSGNTGGITIDPSTGVIYLLDAGSTTVTPNIPRKIFTFTPRVPNATSIAPNKGSFQGGTNVTITGVNFPSDAQVFFDTIPATNVAVNSLTSITCTTPPHGLGAVDVTITGTGIATQLTLSGAYTYINQPPSAALTASPTSGPPPLTVDFNIGASTDIDGTLAQRVITFGDGQSFTFPSDLTVVDTTHVYLANGTYTATLTVTDNLGATGTATQTIIVGTGGDDISDNDLVLRELALTLDGGSKDSVKFRGEFILPQDVPLGNATVDLGISGGQTGGALFSNTLDSNGTKAIGFSKFSLKLLNKRGFDPQTYTLSFSQNNASIKDALVASGLNLSANGIATLTVFVRITTAQGRVITHTKPAAVVTIKAGKTAKSSVKLTRK